MDSTIITDMAADLGREVAASQGWDVDGKGARGASCLLVDVLKAAHADGHLLKTYTQMRAHLTTDDPARVRETVSMLVSGYAELHKLFRRPACHIER